MTIKCIVQAGLLGRVKTGVVRCYAETSRGTWDGPRQTGTCSNNLEHVHLFKDWLQCFWSCAESFQHFSEKQMNCFVGFCVVINHPQTYLLEPLQLTSLSSIRSCPDAASPPSQCSHLGFSHGIAPLWAQPCFEVASPIELPFCGVLFSYKFISLFRSLRVRKRDIS